MDLKLSWDLFIIVFLAIVTAYSFIIGREDTLKIIIGSYVATLSADGIGNLFGTFIGQTSFFAKLMKFLGLDGGPGQLMSIIKILLFIAIIVILTIFGDYEVRQSQEKNNFIKVITLLALATLSGGLILSTIMVFANGGSLISGTTAISDSFKAVYEESRMVRGLLDWHDVWFALPGLLFVFISLFQKNKSA